MIPKSGPPRHRVWQIVHPVARRVTAWIVIIPALVVSALPLALGNPPPVKILPLGDSITRGNNDINHPNGDIQGGYRKELGIRLAGAGVAFDFVGSRSDNAAAGMDSHHDGTPGIRTDEVLATLSSKLSVGPDTVLLMLGTNDILQNKPVATAAANLSNIIEQITGSAPARRLYVATIPPITQAWPPLPPNVPAATLDANANLYNAEVRNLVAHHAARGLKVKLVDINALVVLTNPDPSKNFYQPGDGIHPGQAGYDQLGALWFDAIHTGSSMVDAPPAGLPAAPSGLSVTVASPSRINLAWTDNATNESVYRIRRRELPAGVWEEIAVLPPNTTKHAVTGLTIGSRSYAFTVIASNTSGNSAWSEIAASPSPNDDAHLKTAQASSVYNEYYAASYANNGNLATIWHSLGAGPHHWQVDLASLLHIQQIKLITRQDSYDDPAQRKNFEIRASNDPAFATYTVLASQGADPLPHRGSLTVDVAGSSPFRHLRAAKTDGADFSICLLQVLAADPASVPAAPGDLTATAVDSSHVRLSWLVLSPDESGFKLERKTGVDGVYAEIAAPSVGTPVFVDSGLAAETTFFYRIRATNEAGDSAYSAEASVTTGTTAAYDLWAADYPLFLALPPADQDAAADPNGDGVNNLLAYALGLDPLVRATPDLLPCIEAASAADPLNLFYRFRRNKNAADLDCAVMVSSTLSSNDWSVLSLAGATVADVPGDDGIEQVSVPILPFGGESKRFFKLRVIRQ